MNRTIHPGILLALGLPIMIFFRGGFLYIIGLIMFLSGFAGLVKLAFFSGNTQKKLSDKLDQIYESNLTHDKKVNLSLSAIEKSGLNNEQTQVFVSNVEKAYDISVKS